MNHRASSFNLAAALVGVGVVGLALSMVLTDDTRWMQWHISRLGEGAGIAAAIFNFSLSIAALILVLLAARMTDEIRLRNPEVSVTTLRTMLLATAACWIGVASFPFDRFQILHWVFGYGQFILIGFLMLRLKYLNPVVSPRTNTAGLVGAMIVATLMGLHHTMNTPSLLIVELTGQLAVFIWLLSMTSDLQDDTYMASAVETRP